MTIFEAIRMAIKDIMRARMRSFLTMLGVIIGIFAVISLVTLGEGMKGYMHEQISTLGSGPTYMEVHAGKSEGEMGIASASTPITYQDAKAIAAKCPSVRYVDPRIVRPADFTYRNKTYSVPMTMGATENMIEQMNWPMAEGKFISRVDEDMRRKVIVLGKKVVKALFGSFSPIGEKVRLNGSKFLVIGVMAEKGSMMGFDMDRMAVIPVTTASDVFKLNKLIEIGVVAKSEDLVPAAVSEIKEVLMERHGREDFRVDTMEESMAMLDTVMGALTGIVTGIAAISLLVGGIGIMNIMLVAVSERIREIGIRKAVGAKKRDILIQFLIEAVIISLLGGAIGIIAGVGVASLAMYAIGLPLIVSYKTIILATLVSVMVGIVSGVYPATRAAALDPVIALRYE
jgi:putative ABC transport system permease protein